MKVTAHGDARRARKNEPDVKPRVSLTYKTQDERDRKRRAPLQNETHRKRWGTPSHHVREAG